MSELGGPNFGVREPNDETVCRRMAWKKDPVKKEPFKAFRAFRGYSAGLRVL